MGSMLGAAKSRAKLALAYTEQERRAQVSAAALKRWDGKNPLERRAEMASAWAGLKRWLESREEDVKHAKEKPKNGVAE